MLVIYYYENKLNGKVYIGQTNDIEVRDGLHCRSKVKTGIDGAIKKYGRPNFELTIVEIHDNDEQLNVAEIFWIAEMRKMLGKANVYNQTDGGEGIRGFKHSDASRKKMSDATKGRMAGENNPMFGKLHSDETRQKISLARIGKYAGENSPMYGKHLTEEQKKHLSDINTGKEHTEETKQKMSETRKGKGNGMFGKKHSEKTKALIAKSKENLSSETRQQMSESHKGWSPSEETRQQMSVRWIGDKNPNFGKPLSDITKQKLSEAMTGRTVSEEVKQKLSILFKGRKPSNYGKKASDETKQKLSELFSGENNPRAKLTRAQVVEIKRLLSENVAVKDLVTTYNVSGGIIRDIRSGRTWKQV